jgi:hypothetical protein
MYHHHINYKLCNIFNALDQLAKYNGYHTEKKTCTLVVGVTCFSIGMRFKRQEPVNHKAFKLASENIRAR